jgi:hypothetical protein
LKKDDSRASTPVMSSNDGRSTPSSNFRTISSINELMAASADLLSDHRAAMNLRNQEKAQRKKQKLDMAEKRLGEERIQAAHARSMELRRIELDEQRMADEKARWAFLMNNQKKE